MLRKFWPMDYGLPVKDNKIAVAFGLGGESYQPVTLKQE